MNSLLLEDNEQHPTDDLDAASGSAGVSGVSAHSTAEPTVAAAPAAPALDEDHWTVNQPEALPVGMVSPRPGTARAQGTRGATGADDATAKLTPSLPSSQGGPGARSGSRSSEGQAEGAVLNDAPETYGASQRFGTSSFPHDTADLPPRHFVEADDDDEKLAKRAARFLGREGEPLSQSLPAMPNGSKDEPETTEGVSRRPASLDEWPPSQSKKSKRDADGEDAEEVALLRKNYHSVLQVVQVPIPRVVASGLLSVVRCASLLRTSDIPEAVPCPADPPGGARTPQSHKG